MGFPLRFLLPTLGLTVVTTASAQFTETEPNDTKTTANVISGLTNGATITGTSTGVSSTVPGVGSADFFDFRFAGTGTQTITRHRFVIESNTPGHIGSIWGLGQFDRVIDTASLPVQSTTNSVRFNQWYSFGYDYRFYYRMRGVTGSTDPYTLRLESAPVAVADLGTFQAGPITMTTRGLGHFTDTEIWIYDSNLRPITDFNNDDTMQAPGELGSDLIRDYLPGTYYLAISTYNVANDQAAAYDDFNDSHPVMDFPDVMVNLGSSFDDDLTVGITDGSGTMRRWSSTKAGAYDINFARFEVVPEPASLIMLGVGLAALVRRGRRRFLG